MSFRSNTVSVVALLLMLFVCTSNVDAQRRRQPQSPPPAQEQAAAPVPPDTARDLFERGQAAYQQGDYETALDMWSRAYALEARPQLQFNLAQAYSRLGRLEEERAALSVFVERTRGDDPSLGTARARLVMLEQRLSRTGLSLEGEPYEGAVVVIDGEDRGRLPHPEPFALRPGTHEVSVTLEGYAPFRATVVVPAGEAVAVTVSMSEASIASSESGSSLALPAALYVSGGALILTGSIFGGLAFARSESAVEGSDDAQTVHTFSIIADVTLGVGIAAGATGLILHLTRGGDEREEPSALLVPIVERDLVGVRAVGRF